MIRREPVEPPGAVPSVVRLTLGLIHESDQPRDIGEFRVAGPLSQLVRLPPEAAHRL